MENALPKKLEKLGFKKMSLFETMDMPGFNGGYKRELKHPLCKEFWVPSSPNEITRRTWNPSLGYACRGIDITRKINT